MQIGIDSFAAAHDDASRAENPTDRLRNLVEQIGSTVNIADNIEPLIVIQRTGVSCYHRRLN